MILQVIVPVSSTQVHLIEECLLSIQANTPVDHVVNLAVGNTEREDRCGEIVASGRSVYRSGLVVTCCDPALGYNGVVAELLRQTDFPYTVVLPVTHRIRDKEWFGKMQLPHVRAPGCGMTFAFDELEANTRASHPWEWRQPVPSHVFMLQRGVVSSVQNMPLDLEGDDIATAVRDHLRTMGIHCWAIPSCRVSGMVEAWR